MIWTLDSCSPNISDNCQVELSSSFTFVRFVRKCPAHETLTDDEAGFNVLWNPSLTGENQRGPSNALDTALRNGPTALYDAQPDGSRALKSNLRFNYTWSGVPPNRVLTISFTGVTLTTTQKNTIQTAVNTRFGAGKVVVT